MLSNSSCFQRLVKEAEACQKADLLIPGKNRVFELGASLQSPLLFEFFP